MKGRSGCAETGAASGALPPPAVTSAVGCCYLSDRFDKRVEGIRFMSELLDWAGVHSVLADRNIFY